MCVFFCFCNSCLCLAVCRKELSKCIVQLHFFKRDLFVWNRHVIFGKAYIFHLFSGSAVKSVKVIAAEYPGNLPRPVRPKVEKDNGILIFYNCCRCTVFFNYGRHYKFIRLIIVIRSLHCCHRVLRFYSFSLCQCKICLFDSVPAVVAVHGIISARNRGNLSNADFCHLIHQCLYKTFAG